jgi:hypothetical protein
MDGGVRDVEACAKKRMGGLTGLAWVGAGLLGRCQRREAKKRRCYTAFSSGIVRGVEPVQGRTPFTARPL